MTPEEIAKLATVICAGNVFNERQKVEAAIRAAIREENEACAKIAEELYCCDVEDESGGPCWMYETNIAAAIRAKKP